MHYLTEINLLGVNLNVSITDYGKLTHLGYSILG